MAAKKTTRKTAAKKATTKKPAKVQHRDGTIRSKLEAIYKKHGKSGYAEAKAEAIKKGFNKHTVNQQMYLIHTGQ
jgi:hypothetical protein